MNKYEQYLRYEEEFKYMLLSLDFGNDNIYKNYIEQRKIKDNIYFYTKLRDILISLKEIENKKQKQDISIFLNELNQLKEKKEIDDKCKKKAKEKLINSDINYLNYEEAEIIGKEKEWYKALRTSLLYCYKYIKTPPNSIINIYDLLLESEGFNKENVIPLLYISFCNEYKDTSYEDIIKDLNKKIKNRQKAR